MNLYLEQIERGPRAGRVRLRGTPGLKNITTLPTYPVRALWSNPFVCYAIGGGTLYQIFTNGTAPVPIGPVPNGTNPAIVVSDGFNLYIASAGQLVVAPGGGLGVLPVIGTDGVPINVATIAFIDQYIIGNVVGTKQIRISNLAPDTSIWDPGDASIKEAYADNIQRVWVDQPGGEYIWIFGTDTTEIWTDTGALFPFDRIPSGVFSIGCDSPWSVAGINGWKAWLWRDQIWASTGPMSPPQRISDYGVEQALKTYSQNEKLNAESMAWIDRGHLFWKIDFAETSWVYDATAPAWHERAFFSGGAFSRFRGRVYTRFNGYDLVGDYANGNIYAMDLGTYTDSGGVAMVRDRICPYFTDSLKNTRYNRFTLDIDTGVGLSVGANTVGNNPQVTMRYSPDRGKTWSNERLGGLGQTGQDSLRVFWPQLGSSRLGMSFWTRFSDPVPVSINTAFIDVGQGISPGNRPTA